MSLPVVHRKAEGATAWRKRERRSSLWNSLGFEKQMVINSALIGLVRKRTDIFGGYSKYNRFKEDIVAEQKVRGMNSLAIVGTISFMRGDVRPTPIEMESHRLVLKITPDRMAYPIFHMFSFANEMLFYSKLVPFYDELASTKDMFATYYTGLMQVNADLNAVLVLEDLQPSGFTPSPKKAFLDYAHLELMMKKLGEFHAYSYEGRRYMTEEKIFYEERVGEFPALVNQFADPYVALIHRLDHYFRKISERGLKKMVEDPEYADRKQVVQRLIDQADEYVTKVYTEDKSNPVSVLCHGDYMATNVLFKYRSQPNKADEPGEVRIVDFTSCRFASPVVDLALPLYINADQKMRDENWDKLIDAYYNALVEKFPHNKDNIPSKEAILAEFKGKAPYVYFMASFCLPSLIGADGGEDLKMYIREDHWLDGYAELPEEMRPKFAKQVGGEAGTVALANILKDLLDRGFFVEE